MTHAALPSRPAAEPLARLERAPLVLLERSLSHEWLETDGLGGYASSTPLLCPTRRYHGLLVSVPEGGEKRISFLAGLDESLHRPQRSFPLSIVRYAGLWHPHGHQSVQSFELVPYPRTTFRIGDARVQREVLMPRGRRAVLVRYLLEGIDETVELRLRPLLSFREADALTFENLVLDPRAERLARGIRVRPYQALPPLELSLTGARFRFQADPVWYRGVEYAADLARGYDGHEDLFSPGTFHVDLTPTKGVVLEATIEASTVDGRAAFEHESGRRRAAAALRAPGPAGRLECAAEHFLYRAPAPGGGSRLGVVAGFPWFGEWGRDTFISLPGLLLARGRVEECGAALEDALAYLAGGLLPNVFGRERETSHYGSADAALWFARAARLYDLAGGSRERVVGRFLPALLEIAQGYRDGTALGIGCDSEGLLCAGSPDLNATWMDARVDGRPVTPRHGYAVELNALWYQLLGTLEQLLPAAGRERESREWRRLRRTARSAFVERFWLSDARYLADCWRDGRAERAVRPNMVIAAALDVSPLSRGMRTDVVQRAEVELLTPLGLRTLSPKDPDYRGRHAGGPAERDSAYHQGTVWPWLYGFFCEASLRAYGPRPRRLEALRRTWETIAAELDEAGLDQVSEVFDGDPPHRPGGTIAQAWNVAELLRAQRLLEGAGA